MLFLFDIPAISAIWAMDRSAPLTQAAGLSSLTREFDISAKNTEDTYGPRYAI